MNNSIGTVTSLWRYPIKSLLGEKCQTLDRDQRGVVGDRLFAIADENGKFGSGKTTRRFVKIDRLFELQAHYADHVPVIQFPDGLTNISGEVWLYRANDKSKDLR